VIQILVNENRHTKRIKGQNAQVLRISKNQCIAYAPNLHSSTVFPRI